MEFQYSIGDLVVPKQIMEAVRLEMTAPKQFGRTTPFRILERISKECVGGVQLFYSCENWEGHTGTFSQESLVPFDTYFDAWVKWFEVKPEVNLEAPR